MNPNQNFADYLSDQWFNMQATQNEKLDNALARSFFTRSELERLGVEAGKAGMNPLVAQSLFAVADTALSPVAAAAYKESVSDSLHILELSDPRPAVSVQEQVDDVFPWESFASVMMVMYTALMVWMCTFALLHGSESIQRWVGWLP